MALALLPISFAACKRASVPDTISAVPSPDGRSLAIIARNPTVARDDAGAALCVYDQYIADRGWSDPIHVSSYGVPCHDPPPKIVWRAYNPDGHSFDVHLIDASGHELGAESRTWQIYGLAPH